MPVKVKISLIYRNIKDAFKRYAVAVFQVGLTPLNHPIYLRK